MTSRGSFQRKRQCDSCTIWTWCLCNNKISLSQEILRRRPQEAQSRATFDFGSGSSGCPTAGQVLTSQGHPTAPARSRTTGAAPARASGISLGMGWAKARPGCQPMGGGESGLTRGTSVRHSPTMVGQGCRKRTLACQVRAHSPAQLGGVGHLRGPWPKVADEGWGRPCLSFPLAMLGGLPHVVSQSKVLRATARVLLSLPMFYYFQGGSAALGALLVCTYMSLAYFKWLFFTNVVF